MHVKGSELIGVIGLWHLGCTTAAAWLSLGHRVVAVDRDKNKVEVVRGGRSPVQEPGVDEEIALGLSRETLRVGDDPASLDACRFVFVAHDTPVDLRDEPDLLPVLEDFSSAIPHLKDDVIVIVSAQVPVGTCRRLREQLKAVKPRAELLCIPENLQLGQALARSLRPGYVVVGGVDDGAGQLAAELLAPLDARIFRTGLETAEMAKHAINSFLATSVAVANHWSDICEVTGADPWTLTEIVRTDPRIGPAAYLGIGLGFSGGTLGRDLRVLEGLNRERLGGQAPLFGAALEYNDARLQRFASTILRILPRDSTVCILGMTYKPGTSTLRRSRGLSLARDLLTEGMHVRAHDPAANWAEEQMPANIEILPSAYEAAQGSDLLVLTTAWPEYRLLSPTELTARMRGRRLLDPAGFLRERDRDFRAAGFDLQFGLGLNWFV